MSADRGTETAAHAPQMTSRARKVRESLPDLAPLTDWSWELTGDDDRPHTLVLIGHRAHDGGFDMLYVDTDGAARLFRRNAEATLCLEQAAPLAELVALVVSASSPADGEGRP